MSVHYSEFGAEGLQDLIDDKKPPETLEEMMSHMRMMAFLLAGHNQRIKNLERQINAQDRREGAQIRTEDMKQGDTPNWMGRD